MAREISAQFKGAHKETRVICMSIIDKETLEGVAEQCAKKRVGFVDSPVTGGPARVEAGTLTLIVATSFLGDGKS